MQGSQLLSTITIGYKYERPVQEGIEYQYGILEVPYNLSDYSKKCFITRNSQKLEEYDFIINSITLYEDLNSFYILLEENKILTREVICKIANRGSTFKLNFIE